MKQAKEVLTSKRMISLYWQLGNVVILAIITYLTDIDWVYAPIILPFLNMATKYINQKYL
jgi:hypothetical protein